MNGKIIIFLSLMKRLKGLEVVVFILLVGCVPGPILRFSLDVTKDEPLWGGYKHGHIYKLKHDMFLKVDETDSFKFRRVTINPPGEVSGRVNIYIPRTVSEYKKSPGRFIKVKGMVKKGTKIKCSRLIKYVPVGFGSWLYPFAKILDGEYAGIEVMISNLSLIKEDKKPDLFLHEPNLDLLVKVD